MDLTYMSIDNILLSEWLRTLRALNTVLIMGLIRSIIFYNILMMFVIIIALFTTQRIIIIWLDRMLILFIFEVRLIDLHLWGHRSRSSLAYWPWIDIWVLALGLVPDDVWHWLLGNYVINILLYLNGRFVLRMYTKNVATIYVYTRNAPTI